MRLFLALRLPAEILAEVARVRAGLREQAEGWRWVRPESVHLTLRFLGEVSEDADRASRAAWAEAARGVQPVRLKLAATGVFPPAGRPRVLWLGVAAEPERGLERLSSAYEQSARERGFAPETRPFRAHLTLARAVRGGGARLPERAPAPAAIEWIADEVTLYQSELRPDGARYTARDTFPLSQERIS
ncbi:MAG: RNA 2',3'-cyclic phosphodiesterase [bacterium]|nr:RNA 2',3'-cyclic phosphodiesterase [bacterium]